MFSSLLMILWLLLLCAAALSPSNGGTNNKKKNSSSSTTTSTWFVHATASTPDIIAGTDVQDSSDCMYDINRIVMDLIQVMNGDDSTSSTASMSSSPSSSYYHCWLSVLEDLAATVVAAGGGNHGGGGDKSSFGGCSCNCSTCSCPPPLSACGGDVSSLGRNFCSRLSRASKKILAVQLTQCHLKESHRRLSSSSPWPASCHDAARLLQQRLSNDISDDTTHNDNNQNHHVVKDNDNGNEEEDDDEEEANVLLRPCIRALSPEAFLVYTQFFWNIEFACTKLMHNVQREALRGPRLEKMVMDMASSMEEQLKQVVYGMQRDILEEMKQQQQDLFQQMVISYGKKTSREEQQEQEIVVEESWKEEKKQKDLEVEVDEMRKLLSDEVLLEEIARAVVFLHLLVMIVLLSLACTMSLLSRLKTATARVVVAVIVAMSMCIILSWDMGVVRDILQFHGFLVDPRQQMHLKLVDHVLSQVARHGGMVPIIVGVSCCVCTATVLLVLVSSSSSRFLVHSNHKISHNHNYNSSITESENNNDSPLSTGTLFDSPTGKEIIQQYILELVERQRRMEDDAAQPRQRPRYDEEDEPGQVLSSPQRRQPLHPVVETTWNEAKRRTSTAAASSSSSSSLDTSSLLSNQNVHGTPRFATPASGNSHHHQQQQQVRHDENLLRELDHTTESDPTTVRNHDMVHGTAASVRNNPPPQSIVTPYPDKLSSPRPDPDHHDLHDTLSLLAPGQVESPLAQSASKTRDKRKRTHNVAFSTSKGNKPKICKTTNHVGKNKSDDSDSNMDSVVDSSESDNDI